MAAFFCPLIPPNAAGVAQLHANGATFRELADEYAVRVAPCLFAVEPATHDFAELSFRSKA
jgi:hypothetical protein